MKHILSFILANPTSKVDCDEVDKRVLSLASRQQTKTGVSVADIHGKYF